MRFAMVAKRKLEQLVLAGHTLLAALVAEGQDSSAGIIAAAERLELALEDIELGSPTGAEKEKKPNG
jgi:hypothetical protein